MRQRSLIWLLTAVIGLASAIGLSKTTHASNGDPVKPHYAKSVDINKFSKDWTKPTVKGKGGFDTDFTAYVGSLLHASNVQVEKGDTVTAFNAVNTAIANLSGYDIPTEYRNTYINPNCTYGCALWVMNCIHPYPGVEAAGGCLLIYQHCLNHCGYNYPY